MIKIISVIAALATWFSITACGGTSEAPEIYSDLELARVGIIDRIMPESLEQLESYCDTVVVGEFAEDSVPDKSNEFFPYHSIIRSYNTIEVKQVLLGDVNVGDRLTTLQDSGIIDGIFYTFSDLTPMQKGDEWLFFLAKDDNDVYWVMCDSDGRYPTKNSAEKNRRVTFKNAALSDSYQLGVFDKESFNQSIYDEIVEKYDA
ncbi:MAG: hypothetical protein K2J77_06915 [Oscillospiraceae bacterium]|nr:hypothetical protein [Oscillospiraceae bacterium]